MYRTLPVWLLSLATLAACVSAGPGSSPVAAPSANERCPVDSAALRYSISVASHIGPAVSMELRQKIANAIADVWGVEEPDFRIRNWARYLRVHRELNARLPAQPFRMQGKWRVREGDSAAVLLTYRRGAVPELYIPQQVLRPQLIDWITRAVGGATALASKGRSIADTMPLQLSGAGDSDVTLELRFGWSPRSSAAISAFARQESEVHALRSRAPAYPREYRLKNIEGEVIVGYIIDETGRVDRRSARVISSDGHLFTNSVLSALGPMRFQPRMIDCVVRPMAAIQRFNFSLVR